MSGAQQYSGGSFDGEGSLSHYVIQVPMVSSTVDGQSVKDLFDRHAEAEGIVVTEGSTPVGILMRTTFYQKIGTLYGHSLYMARPVRIIMDSSMMVIQESDNIAKVGMQAMAREQSKLYDYIVVCRDRTYLGVISIRLFLMELSRRNEAQISVLKQQRHELQEAHDQELLLRRDLEHQSATVRNLMDHADQGFLWFGSDLIVKREYSQKCRQIFQKNIAGLSYVELAASFFGEGQASIFHAAFESYFKNNSPVTDNVYLMLLPSDCVILGRNIRFEYRRIENGGQKAVMAVLSDVTERVRLEQTMEAERNRQRLILKAAACQGQIRRMLEDFREIFSGGYRAFFRGDIPFGEGLSELFRAVHTFKGDFSQYGFMDASTHLHVFEDRLLELLRKGPSATMYQVEQAMEDARPDEMLEADLQVINEVWGAGYLEGSEMVSIPKARLSELEACLREGSAGPEEAAALVGSLKLKNLKELLRQYQDYLDYLAGRLMKPSPVFLLEGDDVAVDPDVWADLLQALVHVFRNSMDHGLESEEERLEAGKPLRGLIRCTVTRTDEGRFCLCVSDDGRGLDPEQLKATAVLMGHSSREALDQMCESELCGLIFVDGLSTKCSADALSGRGVGMPAVRSACLRLGGSLEVISTPGMGTTLRFELPEAPSYTEVQQA